jgi:hypothetical protein
MDMATTEKKFLASCGPITRKLFHQAFLKQEVEKETVLEWDQLEKKVYNEWKNKTFFMLQKKGVLLLYLSCTQNDDISKNHNVIKRIFQREQDEQKRLNLHTILETLSFYREQKKKLYELASHHANIGITPNILCKLRKEIDAMNKEKKEKKHSIKAVKTAINECISVFSKGGIPNVDLLRTALDAKASENNDVYAKQVGLVTKTYIVVDNKNVSKKDVPEEIKSITFEYIKDCAKYASYLHVNLINYIFLNENISEEALELLKKIKSDLIKCGMAILPYANAQTIIKSKKLLSKKTLTDAEKRLIKVMELYDPQAASIH